jgi:hypothetical protein
VLNRQVPVVQVLSAQHACPEPPQAVQVPVTDTIDIWQANPVAQVLFAQQGWSEPPHAAQVPVVEPADVWQRFPGKHTPLLPVPVPRQQGCLAPPQGTQLEDPPEVWQTVLVAVQRLFVQQGSFKPPHSPQAPAVQTSVLEVLHALPSALQVAVPPVPLVTQQPPLRQRLPGQQGWLAPPQAPQVCG